MRRSIFVLFGVLLPVISNAQLLELDIREETPIAIPVFTEHTDKIALIVTSSITELQFESNLPIVDDLSTPEQGLYRIILNPGRQVITVSAPNYISSFINIATSQPRTTFNYRIEPLEVISSNHLPVRFFTNRPDATISVDGNLIDPSRSIPLEADTYVVSVTRPGYFPIQDTIEVNSRNTVFNYEMHVQPDSLSTVTLLPESRHLTQISRQRLSARIYDDSGKELTRWNLYEGIKLTNVPPLNYQLTYSGISLYEEKDILEINPGINDTIYINPKIKYGGTKSDIGFGFAAGNANDGYLWFGLSTFPVNENGRISLYRLSFGLISLDDFIDYEYSDTGFSAMFLFSHGRMNNTDSHIMPIFTVGVEVHGGLIGGAGIDVWLFGSRTATVLNTGLLYFSGSYGDDRRTRRVFLQFGVSIG